MIVRIYVIETVCKAASPRFGKKKKKGVRGEESVRGDGGEGG